MHEGWLSRARDEEILREVNTLRKAMRRFQNPRHGRSLPALHTTKQSDRGTQPGTSPRFHYQIEENIRSVESFVVESSFTMYCRSTLTLDIPQKVSSRQREIISVDEGLESEGQSDDESTDTDSHPNRASVAEDFKELYGFDISKAYVAFWKGSRDQLSLHATGNVAAHDGDLKLLRQVLESGRDVNEPFDRLQSETLLQAACLGGQEAVVAYLLSIGADVEAENSLGEKALEIALLNGHDEAALALLQNGAKRTPIRVADGEMSDEMGLLSVATSTNCPKVLEFLLNESEEDKHFGIYGVKALHCSSIYGCWQTMTVLLDHGFDVNIRSSKSLHLTPLMCAIVSTIGSFPSDRWSMRASAQDRLATIKLLLDHGADVNATMSGITSPGCTFSMSCTDIFYNLLNAQDSGRERCQIDRQSAIELIYRMAQMESI